MLAVLRFTVTESESEFLAEAADALSALAACAGYRQGRLARSFEEPDQWCLLLDWESVGTYRRALSNPQVKMLGTRLLAKASPEVSAFDPVLTAGPGFVAPTPVTPTDPDAPVASGA